MVISLWSNQVWYSERNWTKTWTWCLLRVALCNGHSTHQGTHTWNDSTKELDNGRLTVIIQHSFSGRLSFLTLTSHLLQSHHGWTLQLFWRSLVNDTTWRPKRLTHSNPGDRLEEWLNARNTKAQYTKQLRNFLKVSIWAVKYSNNTYWYHKKTDSIKGLCKPMEMGGNRCWKLGVEDPEDSEIQEVILRIQGVVCNRELPPIRKPFKV